MQSQALAENSRFTASRVPFGSLAYFGAGASILVCYGKVLILGSIATLGFPGLEFNPHLQALLMWMLGLVAIGGLFYDRRFHGRYYPLALGIAGVSIIIATLYTHYDPRIETSGYILLVIAALLNQTARLTQLNHEVESQTRIVKNQAEELAALNENLEQRVNDQVDEIEKLARLKRFLAPEVARVVLAEQKESMLESHRSYVVTLFCDIRGFTGFSEAMEPEEVMEVLQNYHEDMGKLVAEFGGTIDHRAGDGLMVFFNDPLPCDQPELMAMKLALSMRQRFDELNLNWQKQGYHLGFGIGIASGYATLGIVGYEDRYDYTANGNAVNLASRLCDTAADGQILISKKTYLAVEDQVEVSEIGELTLKGITKPVFAYNLLGRNGTS
ncbi:MAG: adenylate/guanylate cyclase domain-containing protein [Gammaproteobacteria bacterium]|nr:adenylate/guanylate cyclase domain-containing protein [Gammaproteobacteria bacterium]